MSLRNKIEEQKQTAAEARAAEETKAKEIKKETVKEEITRLLREREELSSLAAALEEATREAENAKKKHQETRKILTDLREETLDDPDVETLPVPSVLRKSEEYASEPEVQAYTEALEARVNTRKQSRELQAKTVGKESEQERINREIKGVLMEHPEELDADLETLRREMIEDEVNQIFVFKRKNTNSFTYSSERPYLKGLKPNRDGLISSDLERFINNKENFSENNKERSRGIITRDLLKAYFAEAIGGKERLFEDIQEQFLEGGQSPDNEDWKLRKISSLLRKVVFNVYTNQEGELASIDYMSGSTQSKVEMLAKGMLGDEEGKLEERFVSRDGYGRKAAGVTREADLAMSQMLDERVLREYATKVLRYLEEKNKLDGWDTVVAGKEKQVKVLREQAGREEAEERQATETIQYQESQKRQAVDYKDKKIQELTELTKVSEEDRALEIVIKSGYGGYALHFPALDALEDERREEFERQKKELYKEKIAALEAERATILAEPDKIGPFYKKTDNTASREKRQGALWHEIEGLKKTREEEAGRWYQENISEALGGRAQRINNLFKEYKYFLEKMKKENFKGTLSELMVLLEEEIKKGIAKAEEQEGGAQEKLSEARMKKEKAEKEKTRLIEESNVIFRELNDENGAYSRKSKGALVQKVDQLQKQITT